MINFSSTEKEKETFYSEIVRSPCYWPRTIFVFISWSILSLAFIPRNMCNKRFNYNRFCNTKQGESRGLSPLSPGTWSLTASFFACWWSTNISQWESSVCFSSKPRSSSFEIIRQFSVYLYHIPFPPEINQTNFSGCSEIQFYLHQVQ